MSRLYANAPGIKKPISQQISREGKLCMTHGEPLNLRQDEIMRMLAERTQKSRENTAHSMSRQNTSNIPKLPSLIKKLTFNRDLSFCHCVKPQYPSRTNSFNAENDLIRCAKCSGIIRKMNLKTIFKIQNENDLSNTNFASASDTLFEKRLRLPPIVDQNRYQKAYLRALRVAKFGTKEFTSTMREFFNHQITPSFIFSYIKHTPRCFNEKPKKCSFNHSLPSERKIYTSSELHRSIFKSVNVNDFLE